MANQDIVIQNWYSTTTYSMYDVTAGINVVSTPYLGPPYWSTVDSNLGHNPSGQFIYAVTAYQRTQDIATVNLTYTGATPQFARGSLYAFTGLPDPVLAATGMVLNAGSNGGSSLWVSFINPGPEEVWQSTSIGAINCPEPTWTTGFFWSPSYTSPWEIQQNVITAKFDSQYQQRQPQGISSNVSIWTLNFDSRTDREAKGIMTFVQNLAGVYSTPILIPASHLYNNPTLKYVLSNPKAQPTSYNQNNVTVTASQVNEY